MALKAAMELIQTLSGHQDRVWGLAWSPSGEQLASCSGDKTVRIWSFHSDSSSGGSRWACDAVLEEEERDRTVRAIDWSPDGQYLATASFDASTAIWRHEGPMWELVATLEGHENEVKSVAWSPAGTALATCGRDRAVWLWEAEPGDEFSVLDVKTGAHTQDVKMVAWHPGGELLASASYDDTIKLWADQGDEWECVQTLSGAPSLPTLPQPLVSSVLLVRAGPGIGHTSTVWAVAFSPDGSRMVSCGNDCCVKVWWDTRGNQGWRLATTLTGHHTRAVYSVAWSSDDVIASASGDNSVCLFVPSAAAADAPDGGAGRGPQQPGWQLLWRQVQAHKADVNCVRWRPGDRSLLASAGDDGDVRIWRCTHLQAAEQGF